MYKLYTDKQELFECDIHLEGASLTDSKARLVIETEDISLLFKGKINKGGKCQIPVKRLKGLLGENVKGTIKLEVIAEDTYFTPWESDFEVEASKKVQVEVKSQDKEVIKEVFRSKEFPVISNYVMMNRVAMSDGNLSKDEKRFIASSLDIGSEAIALGNRLLINDKISDIFIDLMRSKDGVDNAFIKELMINLFSLAREDGSVDTSELELLVKFADKLGLSKRDFEKLKNQAKIKTIQLGGTFNPTEMDREINEVFDKM